MIPPLLGSMPHAEIFSRRAISTARGLHMKRQLARRLRRLLNCERSGWRNKPINYIQNTKRAPLPSSLNFEARHLPTPDTQSPAKRAHLARQIHGYDFGSFDHENAGSNRSRVPSGPKVLDPLTGSPKTEAPAKPLGERAAGSGFALARQRQEATENVTYVCGINRNPCIRHGPINVGSGGRI